MQWLEQVMYYLNGPKYHQDLVELREAFNQLNQDFTKLDFKLKDCCDRKENLEIECNHFQSETKRLQQQLDEIHKLELNKSNEQFWEGYWEQKHPTRTIHYSGRTFNNKQISVPLQVFITENDSVIYNDLKANNLLVTDTTNCDNLILKIYKHTRSKTINPYNYVSDKKTMGVAEFWMFPFELREIGKGDCDDWSHELASYLICAGVPYWRVRIVVGITNGGIGHSTVYVLNDKYDTWYHINSTTDYEKIKNKRLLSAFPTSKDKSDSIGIKNVWFSFNNKFAYSEFDDEFTEKKDVIIKVE